MTQDVQWIRKALIQRKEYDALQKEIETLRIELLAADYEAEHASGWFTAKKKQALIEKRDILRPVCRPWKRISKVYPPLHCAALPINLNY